jgi:hypothetical protein
MFNPPGTERLKPNMRKKKLIGNLIGKGGVKAVKTEEQYTDEASLHTLDTVTVRFIGIPN